jgi:hypothetical protein
MLKSRDFRWYPKKKMMSEVQCPAVSFAISYLVSDPRTGCVGDYLVPRVCPFLENAHEHITEFWYTAISSKVVPEQSGKVESSHIYQNPVCS